EDGIRDFHVTGVQTCALPILPQEVPPWIGLFLPIFALFSAWIAGQNGLGLEGKGLPFVLLTPVSRRRFWLSKGIVLLLLAAAPEIGSASCRKRVYTSTVGMTL